MNVRSALVALTLALSAHGSRAHAVTHSELAHAATGASRASKNRPPLPLLPKAPSLALPKPTSSDVAALDELLSRFKSDDRARREEAVREILEVEPRLVSAIDRRLNEIADRADRSAMKNLLAEIRKQGRDDERQTMRSSGRKGRVSTPDYLDMVSAYARPDKNAWQDLISVAAMSRMLVRMGTVEAARELIDVYVRFGEFLRVDTQLQLERMGKRALAALIEARRHKAEKIARWAERQLDTLGVQIPSEAVDTTDYQVLADVLRAYGRVRDPDAARIVISFANSERAQVREAARQAVALMGDVSAWQLRDTYEAVVGKKPARDFTWERVARELFGEFDRLRQAQVYDHFERGTNAYEQGQYPEMLEAYDKVLARSPSFERRAEMATGYVAYAKKYAEQNRDQAILALYRAERIAEGQDLAKRAKSLLLMLEGEQLLARGVADQVLFRRAIELDPTNQRARDMLAQIERGETKRQTELNRYAAAGTIGIVALLAIAFIGLRRGNAKGARKSKSTAPDGLAPTETEQIRSDASGSPEDAKPAAPQALTNDREPDKDEVD